MNEFCNKKRKREDNEGESEEFTIPVQNKKIKKLEITFPQEISQVSELNKMNINFIESNLDKTNNSFNKDKNSISTLQSKNDQVSSNTKNSLLFNVIKFDENQNQNQNKKKIQLHFEEIAEDKIPKIKSKSFVINLNIKREFLSCSSYSSNNYNNSSHYTSTSNEEYYPYEIGEIIENQYVVRK